MEATESEAEAPTIPAPVGDVDVDAESNVYVNDHRLERVKMVYDDDGYGVYVLVDGRAAYAFENTYNADMACRAIANTVAVVAGYAHWPLPNEPYPPFISPFERR